MSNSIFSKPKVDIPEVAKIDASGSAEKAVTFRSSVSDDDFNIYGAETYCNYRIQGKNGSVIFPWDPARRRSPQSSFRISLGDVIDAVNAGYILWELPSMQRVYKQRLNEYVNRKIKEYKTKYYKHGY